MAEEGIYSNIRELLGALIGRKVMDITQHDRDEFDETQKAYVMLMFDDGSYVKFFVGDAGFSHNVE